MEIKINHFDIEFASLNFRHIQDIIDQCEQRVSAGFGGLGIVLLLGAKRTLKRRYLQSVPKAVICGAG